MTTNEAVPLLSAEMASGAADELAAAIGDKKC